MASFVLVHGAFQGSWVWQRVAEALSEHGHTIHRPTLCGCGHHRHRPDAGAGLAAHIRDIAQYIADEGLIDVVLVGHSYAGLVCCGVAEVLPEAVSRLVLVDGVLPLAGKSFAELGGEPFERMLLEHAEQGGLVRPWPLPTFGIGAESAAWFQERLGPFPLAAFIETYPGSAVLPVAQRAYISCLPAKNPLLRSMAARAGAEGFEMHALMSGHCAPVCAPVELAALLHRLAKGTSAPAAGAPPHLPPLDRRLLEDMRLQLHHTCRRLAEGGEVPPIGAEPTRAGPCSG